VTLEDAELVRLVRDAVIITTVSHARVRPLLQGDTHGSAGYLPFLGSYLQRSGPAFVRISKREQVEGIWRNRNRGCQCAGLLDPEPGCFAEMAIRSAVASATRARKVRIGPASFHKPVWVSELGSLSFFVYLVEGLIRSAATTAAELQEEGHDVRANGLIGLSRDGSARGVLCGGLPGIKTVDDQVRAVLAKAHDRHSSRPLDPSKVGFIRIKGRWIWDPNRPMEKYF